jgi:hypothetical protein
MNVLGYLRDFYKIRRMERHCKDRFMLRMKDLYPRLSDAGETPHFDHHYVYHTSWAARVLSRLSPARHVDIGSDLRLVTTVSAFLPVRHYDYRPASLHLQNLTSGFADLFALPFSTGSVKSLSCMHVIEHIGLGRYGDPLDYDGDLKAIGELKRVIEVGGDLLFVVPVAKPKIMFNAYRVYSYRQIMSCFPDLTLREVAQIPDEGFVGMITDGTTDLASAKSVAEMEKIADSQKYGCGCFWFTREQ